MQRRSFIVLLALLACSPSAPPEPRDTAPTGAVSYRVLEHRTNATPCVEPPEFEVATDEDAWIGVFARETECVQDGGDVELPDVDFARAVAVAAWWRRVPCLAWSVEVEGVVRLPDVVEVRARSVEPAPRAPCAEAVAVLESFVALERGPLFDGTQPVRFVLDGGAVATVSPVG